MICESCNERIALVLSHETSAKVSVDLSITCGSKLSNYLCIHGGRAAPGVATLAGDFNLVSNSLAVSTAVLFLLWRNAGARWVSALFCVGHFVLLFV